MTKTKWDDLLLWKDTSLGEKIIAAKDQNHYLYLYLTDISKQTIDSMKGSILPALNGIIQLQKEKVQNRNQSC